MGTSMAGRRFPVLIFLPKIILIPIANINIEPTKERLAINLSLRKGSTNPAVKVMIPW